MSSLEYVFSLKIFGGGLKIVGISKCETSLRDTFDHIGKEREIFDGCPAFKKIKFIQICAL